MIQVKLYQSQSVPCSIAQIKSYVKCFYYLKLNKGTIREEGDSIGIPLLLTGIP